MNFEVDYSCLHSESWLLNQDNDYSDIFEASTDISSSKLQSDQWSVSFNRVPKYNHLFTDEDISGLNNRPRAATDFKNGATSAVAGETYGFGADIGYQSDHCTLGYWPTGPECPAVQAKTVSYGLSPAPELNSNGCYAPMLGAIGYWVNGASIFGASDGTTYNNNGVWYSSAVEFEVFDLDICNGHAANGEYHHHHYPTCLQEAVGDYGSDHSPVYGWMLDGFPLHGPYQGENTLAESCWRKRDYASDSPTGCADGDRSCVLIDQYDYTKGTTSVSAGPSITGTVDTQSGNSVSAVTGVYTNDYYYDSSCYSAGHTLDSSNGHSHDSLGYHYHVTLDSAGAAAFPYMAGPKYHGCRSDGKCCSSMIDMECSSGSVCGSTKGTTTHSCLTASPPLTYALGATAASGPGSGNGVLFGASVTTVGISAAAIGAVLVAGAVFLKPYLSGNGEKVVSDDEDDEASAPLIEENVA